MQTKYNPYSQFACRIFKHKQLNCFREDGCHIYTVTCYQMINFRDGGVVRHNYRVNNDTYMYTVVVRTLYYDVIKWKYFPCYFIGPLWGESIIHRIIYFLKPLISPITSDVYRHDIDAAGNCGHEKGGNCVRNNMARSHDQTYILMLLQNNLKMRS